MVTDIILIAILGVLILILLAIIRLVRHLKLSSKEIGMKISENNNKNLNEIKEAFRILTVTLEELMNKKL